MSLRRRYLNLTDKGKKMQLPKITVDNYLFDQSSEDIIYIKLNEIDSFPNHPYKVVDDEKMEEMCESIKQYGVTQPVIVRRKDDGRYEMLSGHRRKRASELAGKDKIIAIVKSLTNEEATILMVDSNMNQREKISYSEKAFAYKMKLEAMNKKAGRPTKDNLTPLVSELRTNEKLAEESGESREQIRRYIRLTELIPEILEMVDEERIAFRPAVEISYLSKDNQYVLLDIMQFSDITPSLAQAIHMKKLEQENKLDTDKLEEIMSQEKPNQVEKIKIDTLRFEKVFPKNVVTNKDREDFLFMCAEEHNRRVKNREMSR
ncbi:MAG: ParB/RepB/Spo0J family partition protein [Clostridia bacterium]